MLSNILVKLGKKANAVALPLWCLALLLSVALTACGGGGGSSAETTPEAEKPVAVVQSPAAAGTPTGGASSSQPPAPPRTVNPPAPPKPKLPAPPRTVNPPAPRKPTLPVRTSTAGRTGFVYRAASDGNSVVTNYVKNAAFGFGRYNPSSPGGDSAGWNVSNGVSGLYVQEMGRSMRYWAPDRANGLWNHPTSNRQHGSVFEAVARSIPSVSITGNDLRQAGGQYTFTSLTNGVLRFKDNATGWDWKVQLATSGTNAVAPVSASELSEFCRQGSFNGRAAYLNEVATLLSYELLHDKNAPRITSGNVGGGEYATWEYVNELTLNKWGKANADIGKAILTSEYWTKTSYTNGTYTDSRRNTSARNLNVVIAPMIAAQKVSTRYADVYKTKDATDKFFATGGSGFISDYAPLLKMHTARHDRSTDHTDYFGYHKAYPICVKNVDGKNSSGRNDASLLKGRNRFVKMPQNLNAKADNHHTVVDHATKLQWQYLSTLGAKVKTLWVNVKDKEDVQNVQKQCDARGYGWRLPSWLELLTITKQTITNSDAGIIEDALWDSSNPVVTPANLVEGRRLGEDYLLMSRTRKLVKEGSTYNLFPLALNLDPKAYQSLNANYRGGQENVKQQALNRKALVSGHYLRGSKNSGNNQVSGKKTFVKAVVMCVRSIKGL